MTDWGRWYNENHRGELTPAECAAVRDRLRGTTVTIEQIADRLDADISRSGVSYHVRGACSCDHGVPPLERAWVEK